MIHFRPLEKTDFKLMHQWLNTDYVVKWWDKRPSFEAVVKKYSERIKPDSKIHCYIIQKDSRDIGMIQFYAEDDEIYQLDDSGYAIDLFIGEFDMLYKGYGPKAIKQCIDTLIVPTYNPTYICIDPDEHNEAAIKAYQKVGFKTVTIGSCRDCKTHQTNYMVYALK